MNNGYKQNKQFKCDVSTELTASEYQQRIAYLNENAKNKHYVLFFGNVGCGKSCIIGNLLSYLKFYARGQLIYRDESTTIDEDRIYYNFLDYYEYLKDDYRRGSTDSKVYYEFPITFIPSDKSLEPIELVFVDCEGSHTLRSMYNDSSSKSGQIPNYITVILESDANVKLCFIYDYCHDIVKGRRGGVWSQTNILISAYNEILHYQIPRKREFSKLMIMSKADSFRNMIDKYSGSAVQFALNEVPTFANTFNNEVYETGKVNDFMFYSVGEFKDYDILKFTFESAEHFFNWLYKDATGMLFYQQPQNFLSKLRKILRQIIRY